MNKKMVGAACGLSGSIAGDVARAKFANKLAVAGFDLGPTLAACVGGGVASMLGGDVKLLAGAAVGAAGDGLGRLVTSMVPQLPAFDLAGVNATKAVVAGASGWFVVGIVS